MHAGGQGGMHALRQTLGYLQATWYDLVLRIARYGLCGAREVHKQEEIRWM